MIAMMKKWILGSALLLIIIGFGMGVTAMQILNWDFKKLDTENGEWKIWQFDTSEMQHISADSDSLPVRVEKSEDDNIHVLAYVVKHTDVQVTTQNNELNISAKIRPAHIISFCMFRGLKAAINGIVIQIPFQYAGDLTLSNSNGSLSVTEVQSLRNLSASNSNGRIAIEETAAESMDITNQNGSVSLEQITVQDTIKVKNSNGSIKAEQVKTAAGEFRGANGRISLEDVYASKQLKAQNNNGSIRTEDIFSPNLSFHNDNGSIKGSIKGKQTDFRIVCNVKNGSSNLNSNAYSDRPYLLETETKNGSVRMIFDHQ